MKEFRYLGSLITDDNRCPAEMNAFNKMQEQ